MESYVLVADLAEDPSLWNHTRESCSSRTNEIIKVRDFTHKVLDMQDGATKKILVRPFV